MIPGNNRLVVLWDPPSPDDGPSIDGYIVDHQAASSRSRSARSVTNPDMLDPDASGVAIPNLYNGTEYSVTVRAVNRNGFGTASRDTATPQATTISVGPFNPSPVELAHSTIVGVQTSNTVADVEYRARLAIDNIEKISFGSCDSPSAGTHVISDPTAAASPTATASKQASGVGTGQVSAILVAGTTDTGFFPVAASTSPGEITVQPSRANLTIDGLDGLAGTLNIGDEPTVRFEGRNLATGVGYSLEVTTSDTSKLGFSSACNQINAARVLRSASGTDDHVDLTLHACVAVHRSTVTATLKFGDTVVATATKFVNVKPAIPTNVHAIGHGESATLGTVTIRVDQPDTPTDYLVRYKTCTAATIDQCAIVRGSWVRQDVLLPATAKSFTVGGQTQSVDEIVLANVTLGALYRVEVSAIVGGISGVPSDDYSDVPVLVYTTHERANQGDTGRGDTVIAGVSLDKSDHIIDSHRYTVDVCTNNKLNHLTADQWFSVVNQGLDLVPEKVAWAVDGGTGNPDSNIIQVQATRNDSCLLVTDITNTAAWGQARSPASRDTFARLCGFMPLMNEYACACHPAAGDQTLMPLIALRRVISIAGANWSDTIGSAAGTCSRVAGVVTHETVHVFGLLDNTTSSTVSNVGLGLCSPTQRDVAAIMSIYQSHYPE